MAADVGAMHRPTSAARASAPRTPAAPGSRCRSPAGARQGAELPAMMPRGAPRCRPASCAPASGRAAAASVRRRPAGRARSPPRCIRRRRAAGPCRAPRFARRAGAAPARCPSRCTSGCPFQHQQRALAGREAGDLGRHQRVGDVEHQQRDLARTEDIGQAELLQRALQRVVEPALHHQPDVGVAAALEALRSGRAARCRPAPPECAARASPSRGGRSPAGARAACSRSPPAPRSGRVSRAWARGCPCRHEAAAHVAGADAQLHDRRHVARLAEREGMLDAAHHVGPARAAGRAAAAST